MGLEETIGVGGEIGEVLGDLVTGRNQCREHFGGSYRIRALDG